MYESHLAKFQRPAQTTLEGIDVNKLPGPDALHVPGVREGQTKLVKEGEVITVHNWSQSKFFLAEEHSQMSISLNLFAEDQVWIKMGEVVGQPGKDKPANSKITYEGKEYDYVFDIDIDDGVMLKLPYNLTEDPWMAAQQFIHK